MAVELEQDLGASGSRLAPDVASIPARWAHFAASPWLLLIPVLVTSGLIVLLVAFVLLMSFNELQGALPSQVYSLKNYVNLYTDPIVVTAALNTVQFGLTTVVVAMAFGLPIAWLVERTDLPGKRVVWTTASLGILIPGFLTAMGWLFLLHPRIGVVNTQLIQWFWLEDAPFPITTVLGMGWVQGLILAPLFLVITAATFRAMDPALEEAAAISGAGLSQSLRRIVIPLVWPGLLSACIYTLVISLGAFDVPGIIGLSNRILTFSTLLFIKLTPAQGLPDYGIPAAFGTLVIGLALLLSAVYANLLRKSRQFQVVTGKAYRPRQIRLGAWTIPAWLFVGLYLLLAQVIPFILLVWAAFLPYMQPPSADAVKLLTLANFSKIPWDLLLRAGQNTVLVALLVPTITVGLSVAFAWIVLRSKFRLRLLFDAIAFLPNAVPHILIAVSAAMFALFVLRSVLPLYGSLALMIVVFAVAWLSLGTRVINSSLIQIHPELEEAGYMSGAGGLAAIRRIVLPLLLPAMSSAWIWLALLSFRELTMGVVLYSPASVTLPLVVWGLWVYGAFNESAAISLIIICVLCPVVIAYFAITRRTQPEL